jgi:hypothetical protein
VIFCRVLIFFEEGGHATIGDRTADHRSRTGAVLFRLMGDKLCAPFR